MSRLSALADRFEDLWKARKSKSAEELAELAQQLDEAHGPWDPKHGSRAEAVPHYIEHGRTRAASLHREAPEGSPQFLAAKLASDIAMTNGLQGPRVARTSSEGDTIQGPLDEEHLRRYATKWAEHQSRMEFVQYRAKQPERIEFLRPSTVVLRRLKEMQSEGHARTHADPTDLRTIHAGVEHAARSGKVPQGLENRYRVMHEALKISHETHFDAERPGPFKPSFAGMDTGALQAMKIGAEHLHELGLHESQQTLLPVITSALASHEKHPFHKVTSYNRGITAVAYPNLHPIGSPEADHQDQVYARMFSAHLRNQETQKPSVKLPESVEPPKPAMPASFEEYSQRQEAGETFSPEVHLHMALQRRVKKAFGAATLYKSWKTWRAYE
jgi:hypothetical protein